MERRLLIVLAVAMAVAVPGGAAACVNAYFDPKRVELLDRDVAQVMVDAATTVDFVEVESRAPFDLRPWAGRAIMERIAEVGSFADAQRLLAEQFARVEEFTRDDPVMRFTFRVLERLKGRSPDRFDMVGMEAPAMPEGSPNFAGRSMSREETLWHTYMRDMEFSDYATSCNDGLWVFPEQQRYLVFRGADGRTLGPVLRWRRRDTGEVWLKRGPAFEAVAAGSTWEREVRRAADRARKAQS